MVSLQSLKSGLKSRLGSVTSNLKSSSNRRYSEYRQRRTWEMEQDRAAKQKARTAYYQERTAVRVSRAKERARHRPMRLINPALGYSKLLGTPAPMLSKSSVKRKRRRHKRKKRR